MTKGFCKIVWGKLLNTFLEMYASHQHGKGFENICGKGDLSFLNVLAVQTWFMCSVYECY